MDEKVLQLAAAEGFHAAVIDTEAVPVNAGFRVFCEENLCGNFSANYACPPDCGSPEKLHREILEQQKALVVQTVWDISSYEDREAVARAKNGHNAAILRLMEKLKELGCRGFCSGYNGCPLCDPCLRKQNRPCAHPDKRIGCMSAYCIDVKLLAQKCRLEFDWVPNKLYLFGMIAYHYEN